MRRRRGAKEVDVMNWTAASIERAALLVISSVILTVTQFVPVVSAQQRVGQEQALRQKLNENTVHVLGGSISSAALRMADDLSRAIGDGDKLRILPIRADGGTENVRDILYMPGVDMGLVNIDALESLKGQKLYEGLRQRIAYVTRLHNEEFHLISDGKIKSVSDLKGKVVAFHDASSLVSGSLILAKLGLKPAKSVKMPLHAAAVRIRRGEVDAVICVTGKPFGDLERLLKRNADLRLVPIDYSEALQQSYLPASLTDEDYPGLIEPGNTIQTVAVGSVLAVFNWSKKTDRYWRLYRFVNAFFSNFDKVIAQTERHPKWSEVNLAARLPGWKRFKPAADWLAANRKSIATRRKLKAAFEKFLKNLAPKDGSKQLTPSQREELFSQFVRWRENVRP
ncbi:MAG: TAXI family TRAP transporter solute-binding subunit [Methyloligellaceae bacterium]